MLDRFIRPTLLASITGALILSAPASAGAIESTSAEVRFGDLDLTSEADVTRLQHRIRRAAKAVCGASDIRDLKASQAAAACRTAALANAAPKAELAVANARDGQSLAANAAFEVGKPGDR